MKSPKNFVVGTTIVLCLGLLGFALLQIVAEHHSATLLSAAAERRAELRNELRRTEQKATEFERRRAAVAAPPRPGRSLPVSKIPMASLGEIMAKDPRLAELWVKARGAALNKNYGPLFRTLNLPPEQVQQLKRIMVDRIARDQDIYDTAQSSGLSAKDPSVVALLAQSENQARADETALLGQPETQQLQEYDRSLSVRMNFVQRFAADVAFTEPLSFQQGEKLTQVLANASPTYRSGGNVDLWHDGTIDWVGVDQQIQTVLSSGQFAAWQQNYGRLDAQLQTSYSAAAKTDGLGP